MGRKKGTVEFDESPPDGYDPENPYKDPVVCQPPPEVPPPCSAVPRRHPWYRLGQGRTSPVPPRS
ncbi:unnamed protein product, partial [Vitis vinifera]